MSKTATFTTAIDAQVKEAATQFCKQRGLKLQYFVEKAIVEQLEDEMDLDAYHARRDEENIALEDLLAKRK